MYVLATYIPKCYIHQTTHLALHSSPTNTRLSPELNLSDVLRVVGLDESRARLGRTTGVQTIYIREENEQVSFDGCGYLS